jgi:hypothetical protein
MPYMSYMPYNTGKPIPLVEKRVSPLRGNFCSCRVWRVYIFLFSVKIHLFGETTIWKTDLWD